MKENQKGRAAILFSKVHSFFQRTTTKIVLGIMLITSILLTYISVFAITTAQNEFQTASVKFVNGTLLLVKEPLPPPLALIQHQFNEKLLDTLILAAILGFIMSIIAGIIFSVIITQPLRALKVGINNLKKSKYKDKLEETGEAEFDDVIDEFNELAEELESQESLRKDLISDVSHELKTPLTSIIGQIEGMKDGVLDMSPKRLESIHSEAERLSTLIEMLQEYTRLRSKIPNIHLESLNVHKIMEEISESYTTQLSKENMKIINNVPENLEITADKTLFYRILNNLIDNAIKYSKGTEIVIGGNTQELYISDNGVGIEEKDIKKIFERFYRVEKSRNRKTGGLGLGLSLVKEMVEAHGWEIEAISNKKDNTDKAGVKFIIKFTRSS